MEPSSQKQNIAAHVFLEIEELHNSAVSHFIFEKISRLK